MKQGKIEFDGGVYMVVFEPDGLKLNRTFDRWVKTYLLEREDENGYIGQGAEMKALGEDLKLHGVYMLQEGVYVVRSETLANYMSKAFNSYAAAALEKYDKSMMGKPGWRKRNPRSYTIPIESISAGGFEGNLTVRAERGLPEAAGTVWTASCYECGSLNTFAEKRPKRCASCQSGSIWVKKGEPKTFSYNESRSPYENWVSSRFYEGHWIPVQFDESAPPVPDVDQQTLDFANGSLMKKPFSYTTESALIQMIIDTPDFQGPTGVSMLDAMFCIGTGVLSEEKMSNLRFRSVAEALAEAEVMGIPSEVTDGVSFHQGETGDLFDLGAIVGPKVVAKWAVTYWGSMRERQEG